MKIGKIKFPLVGLALLLIPTLMFLNNCQRNDFCNVELMIDNLSGKDSVRFEVFWDDILIVDKVLDENSWYETFRFNTSWGGHTLTIIVDDHKYVDTSFVFPMKYFIVEYNSNVDSLTEISSFHVISNALPINIY